MTPLLEAPAVLLLATPAGPATGGLLGLTALRPSPSPSATSLQAPPSGSLQTIGAIAAIVLALAAGILAYRVIRGGRGL